MICLNELGAAGGGSFPLPEGGRRFVAEVFGQVWDMQCMLHCYIHLSEVPLAFSGEVSAVSAVSVVSPPESKGNFCIFLLERSGF